MGCFTSPCSHVAIAFSSRSQHIVVRRRRHWTPSSFSFPLRRSPDMESRGDNDHVINSTAIRDKEFQVSHPKNFKIDMFQNAYRA
jgi:hypothetical protein